MQYPYLPNPPLKQVFYDRALSKTTILNNVKSCLKENKAYQDTTLTEISHYKDFIRDYQNNYSLKYDRETLLLYPEKGDFMHSCPGSDGVLCCRYHVLDFGMNCPYDCHYCFLQTYAKLPFLTVAGNVEELLLDLKEKISAFPAIHWRIGTGEYADSLALDNLTGIGKILVGFFSSLKNATLELKTKSVEIASLLELDHKNHTVISWSLNPDYIVEKTEYNASSLQERLQAAKRVIDAGYQVGFHLDPVIWYDNWEKDYADLIDRLFTEIPSRCIRWISIGTFRYSPGLKEKLRLKHPEEFITRSEMFLAPDGKYRYLAPLREKIYRRLSQDILKRDPQMMLYLCMETRAMWQRVFQKELSGPAMLDQEFEKRRLLLQAPKQESKRIYS